MDRADLPSLNFVFKVTSRCNLNCSYCYVYNKGDDSWRAQPALMSDETFSVALSKVGNYLRLSRQTKVNLIFHGGEPCLIGVHRFEKWCDLALTTLSQVQVRLTLQTNGTLLNAAWAGVIRKFNVNVGVSLDGPPAINDAVRVDHKGRATYARIAAGIRALQNADIPVHILCVIPLGQDGADVHRQLAALGAAEIDYLLPDFDHDRPPPSLAGWSCADFLAPIFKYTISEFGAATPVRILNVIGTLVLGGDSSCETFGNQPHRIVFIESDGEMDGLDVLKINKNRLRSGCNIHVNEIIDLKSLSEWHRTTIFEGLPIPTACTDCPEATTCAGGSLPHRFGAGTFDHPTVWCEDIKRLFGQVRAEFDVSVEETHARRRALAEL